MSRLTNRKLELLSELELLRAKHKLSIKELETLIKESRQFFVPFSVFGSGVLSPLEAVVKYLHEDLGLRLCEVGVLLGRDQRVVGVTYRRARGKMSVKLPVLLSCAFM